MWEVVIPATLGPSTQRKERKRKRTKSVNNTLQSLLTQCCKLSWCNNVAFSNSLPPFSLRDFRTRSRVRDDWRSDADRSRMDLFFSSTVLRTPEKKPDQGATTAVTTPLRTGLDSADSAFWGGGGAHSSSSSSKTRMHSLRRGRRKCCVMEDKAGSRRLDSFVTESSRQNNQR